MIIVITKSSEFRCGFGSFYEEQKIADLPANGLSIPLITGSPDLTLFLNKIKTI